MKLSRVFDYIYYRLTKFYLRWDGKNGSTSIIGVSMIQAMLLINLALIILICFIDKNDLTQISKKIAWFSVILFFITYLYNNFKYKDKYDDLEQSWRDEPTKKKYINGFLVLFALLFPWIMLGIMGLLLWQV